MWGLSESTSAVFSVLVVLESSGVARSKLRGDPPPTSPPCMPFHCEVACRPPYAIDTKKVELTGWKRFEMNNLMRFSGVTEDGLALCRYTHSPSATARSFQPIRVGSHSRVTHVGGLTDV